MAFASVVVIAAAFLPPAGAEEPDVTPLPVDTHLSKRYTKDLDGLLKRHYIRVLTTLSKTNFSVIDGRFFGLEYDLLREYEKFLNRGKRPDELRVVLEFIPVGRDQLIPKLVEGYGDIVAANLTVTPEREAVADFTDPYLTGIDEVVVTHRGVPAPTRITDLSGREVFVRESSNYYQSLQSLNRALAKMGMKPVKIVRADESLETEDILELVNAGAVKMTLCDSHIAALWAGVFPNIVVHDDVAVRRGTKIAWMVRKNCPKLKASLDEFLKTHRKGTAKGNILFNRYYRKNPWIRNPLSAGERRKFEKYRALFRKYAKKYGFDWVMIMAMAYQESGLDNDRRSPSGAVGVMQITPAAAKQAGVADILSPENNIRAGIRYLAYLRDTYFNEQGIHPRDKVRFTFAAYNAGPSGVMKMRKKAKAMGLDPDRWFRNVEIAALKTVGQEPVRYVSNINKYYIIYRRALEAEKQKRGFQGRT